MEIEMKANIGNGNANNRGGVCKAELSTALLSHIMCVGTYDTVMSGESEIYWEYERLAEDGIDQDEHDVEVEVDDEANERCIKSALETVLSDDVLPFLGSYGVSDIKVGGWYHPRQYNFETDSLDLDFFLDSRKFVERALEEMDGWRDDEDVADFIRGNFATRDGFLSFCPESLDELIDAFSKNKGYMDAHSDDEWDLSELVGDRAIAEYITILLHREFGDESLQESLNYAYQDETGNVDLMKVTIDGLDEYDWKERYQKPTDID